MERAEVVAEALSLIRFPFIPPDVLSTKVSQSPLLGVVPALGRELLLEAFQFQATQGLACQPVSGRTVARQAATSSLFWSDQHRHPSVRISKDRLTCTSTGPAYYTVRSHTGFSGGKQYFEVSIKEKSNWMVFGVCDERLETRAEGTTWPDSYKSSANAVYHHGYPHGLWSNGVQSRVPNVPTPGGYGKDDVVGVLLDFIDSRVTFYLNGKEQGAPLPFDSSLTYYPFVTLYDRAEVSINSPPKLVPGAVAGGGRARSDSRPDRIASLTSSSNQRLSMHYGRRRSIDDASGSHSGSASSVVGQGLGEFIHIAQSPRIEFEPRHFESSPSSPTEEDR